MFYGFVSTSKHERKTVIGLVWFGLVWVWFWFDLVGFSSDASLEPKSPITNHMYVFAFGQKANFFSRVYFRLHHSRIKEAHELVWRGPGRHEHTAQVHLF
jgi:hypothetical protein